MLLRVETVNRVIPEQVLPRTGAKPRRVGLIIRTQGAYGRGVLRGVAKYAREHPDWFVYFHPDLPASQRAGDWNFDGLLIEPTGPTELPLPPASAGIAVLSVNAVLPSSHTGSHTSSHIPYICVDDAQVARLAATHLIDHGMEHLGFSGPAQSNNPSLALRGKVFAQFVEQAGHVCHTFSASPGGWEQTQSELARWVAQLPKPVGILACNDAWGLRLLDACRRCGAQVPDEIAVVGVDNDLALCDLPIPPMSSVDVNADGIGYEAARLLDRMMSGEGAPAKPVLLAPRGVVTRQSSDVIASEDEEVGRAVRFIRERACCAVGFQVDDVLGYTGLSRASLQQRMKKMLGHTIHQEIQRARLTKAKELLAMSGMTIKQVARQSGFASVQYMTRVFRAGTGETPARYRSRRTG